MSQKIKQRFNISPAQFVVAWESASTVQEAAENCTRIAGKTMRPELASARASLYRRAGVPLKFMYRKIS